MRSMYIAPILTNIFETLCTVDSKHEQKSFTRSHILISHCRVFFLTGRVQNIQ